MRACDIQQTCGHLSRSFCNVKSPHQHLITLPRYEVILKDRDDLELAFPRLGVDSVIVRPDFLKVLGC